ncbi:hypothetical protein CONLIGDRAFT_716965 [Coniochaeta ligniaria NRRL 30616]|uniref:Cora-domain-containing protein n=1 Tax=Coniochaeta ligniaria NRRL 30616 TaxID=1408157 RepID=A0A1J7IH03_9PEZI|nr:hypothetical protein CONLIGDRAFT_716965 [Coniochaeta ligniaria NRRL 30616]
MNEVEVKTLQIVANAWQMETTTWDRVLKRDNRPKTQLIFASLRAIANAPDKQKGRILEEFNVPPFLLHRTCLESNGFSGCEPVLDGDGNLEHYNHWSRFVIKQTHERLQPKPSFTRHNCSLYKPVHGHSSVPNSDAPIHDSRSIQHGWEWYDIGFFIHWTPPCSTTIICSDLPQHAQTSVQSALTSRLNSTEFSDPYAVFAVLLYELVPLYDNSVWSIRNHICEWEKTRQQEPDYPLLHELAKHAIHVSETLGVATQTVKDFQRQYRDFTVAHSQSNSVWRRNHNPFHFPLRVLDGLLSRSESNKARVQNETSLAFHIAAQRDSRIQVRIGEEAQKETTAMKAIALITMTFLPATFVSSVFSMPFFYFKQSEGGTAGDFTVSDQLWIYCALAAPLSLCTLALWAFWDVTWDKRQWKCLWRGWNMLSRS